MDTLTFAVDRDLQVEERFRLKDRIADAYREVTGTTAEIGVDRFEVRHRDRPSAQVTVNVHGYTSPLGFLEHYGDCTPEICWVKHALTCDSCIGFEPCEWARATFVEHHES